MDNVHIRNARVIITRINKSMEDPSLSKEQVLRPLLNTLDPEINCAPFFEEFGNQNGFPALGRLLFESEDAETVRNSLRILTRAMKVGGDPCKYSLLRTMTLLPIADVMGTVTNGETLRLILNFIDAMFVPFPFAEYVREGAIYNDRSVVEAIKPIFPLFERLLLSNDPKVSMAATKAIGYLCKLRYSRVSIDINDFMSEFGYARIIDQIFNRYGEALATHVFVKLLRRTPKATVSFFKHRHLLRLKEVMDKRKFQDSLFFVLLRKLSSEIVKPRVKFLYDAGIVEFLKKGIIDRDIRFSEFNKVQALTTLKNLTPKLTKTEIEIIVDADFFRGLDETLKNSPLVKSKLAVLKIVEAILRNGWDQAMRRKSRINDYAKFVKKREIKRTIFALTTNETVDKRVKERANNIVNKHLL